MSDELIFASTDEAFQHLANITGKRIKIAADLFNLAEEGKKLIKEKGQLLDENDLKDLMKQSGAAISYFNYLRHHHSDKINELPKFFIDFTKKYKKELQELIESEKNI